MPVSGSRRHRLLAFVVLPAVLLIFVGSAQAATNSYLRPNANHAASPWAVVGAPNAWEALDENVTASQTPTNDTYVVYRRGVSSSDLTVDLSTASLAGRKILAATAWFYTPNGNPIRLEVRLPGQSSPLATTTSQAKGWRSVAVPITGQAELDQVYFDFDRAASWIGGSREVYAAFLRLSLESSSPPPPPPPPPGTPAKVYWGAWMDGEVYGRPGDAPWDATTWSTFEAHAGKPVSIVHFGQPPPWSQSFAAGPLDLTRARGAIPLVDMASTGASLAEIAYGARDSYLASWASAVRNYAKPFFLRWNWEMNGTWFQWGKEAAVSPAQYVAAWRHFHDLAEAWGATNITWVWCPNTKFTGSTPLASLYPGNAYVDWTCLDSYNAGTSLAKSGGWNSFSSLISPTYAELLSLAPSKPIMIGETGSTDISGAKAGWISDALGTQLPVTFPRIKAINWFNWNIEEGGGRREWPIESSPSAQAAFAKAISSPYYAANTFGSLPPLTRIQPLP
jgi:hypothetical protein